MDPSLSVGPAPHKPKLLDTVREVLRRKHYSLRTERSDVDWIKRFIRFHGKRHPREMGVDEVRAFLTHLAVEGQVAASTQNHALSCSPTAKFWGLNCRAWTASPAAPATIIPLAAPPRPA